MERNDRRRADALDRYWDAVQRGEQPASSPVDDFAAAVIPRVNEGHARPNIDAYHRRVRLRVLEPISQKEDPVLTPARPGIRPVATPEIPAWRSRFAPLAAAVVLVLVAAAGYLAIVRDDDDRPNSIPAAVVATPSPDDPVIEPVFTVTLPAEEIPSGDGVSSGLALFTIPVGHRATWEPTCCPGPMIEYVVEGSYGVRATAPIEVVRANGATEEIAAGAEVTLAAGDALISRNETVVEVWNAGDIPVVLLNWMTIDGANGHNGHNVPGWVRGPTGIRFEMTPSNGLATATLLRVTLPNGGVAALDDPGTVYFGARLADTDGWVTHRSDGSVEMGSMPGSPFVAYVLRLEQDPTAGTPPAGSPEANSSA